MSDYSVALVAAAARATYGEARVLQLVPLSGREAPNVIDLESRRAERSPKSDD